MANYWVVQHPDGGWSVKREGAERISEHHERQADAIAAAHPLVIASGGGELIVKGRDGKIRQKDTIGRPDPFPPAG